MRALFLDTYWLPLRVVAGLKWHLLWLAVLPPAFLMARADGYFPLNLTGVLLFTLPIWILSWRIVVHSINHQQSSIYEYQFNTHFIWDFFILLTLPYFLSYVILQLFLLVEIIAGSLPIILLEYGVLTLCLAFLGTSLPASVAERGEGLTAAMRRGFWTFRWLAPRLMIGPAAIFTLPMISPIFDTYGGLKGLLIDPSHSAPDIPLWLAILSLALPPVAAIQAYVLLAVAYRRGEDAEAPVAETETEALTEEPRAG